MKTFREWLRWVEWSQGFKWNKEKFDDNDIRNVKNLFW